MLCSKILLKDDDSQQFLSPQESEMKAHFLKPVCPAIAWCTNFSHFLPTSYYDIRDVRSQVSVLLIWLYPNCCLHPFSVFTSSHAAEPTWVSSPLHFCLSQRYYLLPFSNVSAWVSSDLRRDLSSSSEASGSHAAEHVCWTAVLSCSPWRNLSELWEHPPRVPHNCHCHHPEGSLLSSPLSHRPFPGPCSSIFSSLFSCFRGARWLKGERKGSSLRYCFLFTLFLSLADGLASKRISSWRFIFS